MSIIRDILTRFGFQVDSGKLQSFSAQIEATKGRLRAATRAARAFRAAAVNLGSGLRGLVGAYLGVGAIKLFTTGYTEGADSMLKFAQSVGISTDALQEWEYTAGLANVNSESFRKSIGLFSKNIEDAKDGMSTAKRSFKDLFKGTDVNIDQFQDLDSALTAVIEQFAAMPAGTKKTQLAKAIFGRQGREMIQIADQGAEGIKQLRLEAHKLGAVIGEKQAKQAEIFNDQLTRFKTTLRGVRNVVAAELIPKLTEILNRFLNWYKSGNNAERMLKWLRRAIHGAAVAMASFVAVKVLGFFKQLGAAVMVGVRALRALARAGLMAQIKLFAIVAAVAALALLIEDLHGFATGKDSLIGRVLGDSKDAAALKAILLDFGAALKEMWATLKPALIDLWAALKPLLVAVWEILKPLIPIIVQALTMVIKIITVALTLIVKMITGLIEGAKATARAFVAAWEWAVGVVRAVIEALGTAWDAVVAAVQWVVDWVIKIWDAITAPIKAVFAGIAGAGAALWNGLVGGLAVAVGKIKKFFSWVGGAATAAWAAITGDKGRVAESGGSLEDVAKRAREQAQQFEALNFANLGALGPMGGLAQAGSISQSLSVGAVNVTVQGSTNMTPEQMQVAVGKGTKTALHDVIVDEYSNYRRLARQTT